MPINTADKLFARSNIDLLETYMIGSCKIYKLLLHINRYESMKFSPLAVDNIIMTIYRNEKRFKICYNVLEATSARCRSIFETYKEALGEYEFADYIRALHNHVKKTASALGIDGRTAHIILPAAWKNATLAQS